MKRRFGVETLEEAFFAATGREFVAEEGDDEDDDEYREVFAMSDFALETRNQLVGLFGIVERNVYLTKRYFLWDVAFMVWTIANTLTIVFIARAAGPRPGAENTLATQLLVGATIWAFLGIIFEFMTETVAWERWEGTIEYTFMAPLSRLVHLFGQGAYRGALRPDPGDDPLLRGRRVHRHPRAERELRARRSRCSRSRRSRSSASGS